MTKTVLKCGSCGAINTDPAVVLDELCCGSCGDTKLERIADPSNPREERVASAVAGGTVGVALGGAFFGLLGVVLGGLVGAILGWFARMP